MDVNHASETIIANSDSLHPVIIDRVRHFVEISSSSFVNAKDEITLYNKDKDRRDFLFFIYDLEEYRTSLHISDSDGSSLEFAGNDENKVNKNEIKIYFPKDRPLLNNEYRTIIIEYIQSIPISKLFKMEFRKYKGANTYIFIKRPEDYDWDTLCENKNVNISNGSNFIEISSKSKQDEKTIVVWYVLKIPKSILNWYKAGGSIGFCLFILIIFGYHYNPLGFQSYIVLTSICISFLLLIKGWLFQRGMDRVHRLYDFAYMCIISLLFVEIALMIIDVSFYASQSYHLSQPIYSAFNLI